MNIHCSSTTFPVIVPTEILL